MGYTFTVYSFLFNMEKEIKLDKVVVTCIDDTHKPNDIRLCNWIVKGKDYTVVGLKTQAMTGERFFILAEVQPDKPYGGYKIERFALSKETIMLIEEKIKEGELIEELV